jgi:hypothetical protein
MSELTLHGVSRGDSSLAFRRFWVFHLYPEEGKIEKFRYDINYNPNKNNIENTDITVRPLPEIWRESFGAQYGLG